MINTVKTMFTEYYPNLMIVAIYRLSKSEYVVEALEDVNVKNYNDPFYKVNINTGRVTGYLPILELDRFMKAVEKNRVYKK